MNIGAKIKEIREDKNFTQQELADMILKSRSSLQKYENGQISINVDVLEDIAKALDVDIITFFENNTQNLISQLKKRLNLKNIPPGQLEYDLKFFLDFLKFKYK